LRDTGRTVWRQIEDAIAADIAHGVYPIESQLPTEKELAARFDVNRHTVRRAVSALAQRGMLLVEQGRGSFVVRDAIDYALGSRTRFSENLLLQGREPGTELLRAAEEAANPEVARQLKIRPGAKVVLLETLGRADGRPISLGCHYFPARWVPGMIETFPKVRSITKSLRQLGIDDYKRISTRVTSRLPTSDEAQRLRMSKNQPLLITEGINVESGGRPIEYVLGLFASDRVQLVVSAK
jgi:GntR family phosphonate transport system transcriptional regulator